MIFNLSFNKSNGNKSGGYTIGVSSGMFGAAQPQEKISMIDLSQKGFYAALKGVNFTQIDLETSTELISPEIAERLERIRGLGIGYGVHGETPAMGGAQIALTSAIEDQYITGHQRFIQNLEGCGILKSVYYLQHSCEGPPAETPYIRLGEHMQPSSLVDVWGRRLYKFLEGNPSVLDWLIDQPELYECLRTASPEKNAEYYRKSVTENIAKEKGLLEKLMTNRITEEEAKEILGEVEKRLPEVGRNATKEQVKGDLRSSGMGWGTERVAYLTIAKWLSDKKDPIWMGIVGDKSFEDVRKEPTIWVPAVAAKYIWGHMNPLPDNENKFKDPKKILEKYRIYFVIETPMVSRGMETEYRLTRPKHFITLCKNSGTSCFKIAIDFEHILGAGIKPDDEIESFGSDEGRFVKVLHVGWPTPLEPGHIPIPLGSEQQEWLYRWMLALRKKGFSEDEDRLIIFERAGGVGGDPVDQSTLALKKIVEFLRKGVPVDKLPPEFFGIEEKDLKMQETEIREHAFDPIKGLLTIPEEKHTFLGKAAVEKGKAKEWETEKYK